METDSALVKTTKHARAVIEEIGRLKGKCTDEFKREAVREAESGRKRMLQLIESSEEMRKDLASSLKT
jgi:hypothetical protein